MFFALIYTMKQKFFALTLFSLMCTLFLASLSAADIQDLLSSARRNSIDAQILELQLRQSTTSLELNAFVPDIAYEVSTGNAVIGKQSYQTYNGSWVPAITTPPAPQPNVVSVQALQDNVIGLSMDVNNDIETMIQAGFEEILYDFTNSEFKLKPSISVRQPLSHFYTDNAVEELEDTLISLQADLTYEEGMKAIEQQVLEAAETIITSDKEISDISYSIQTETRNHERALKLGTYSETSPQARTAEQTISTYEQSLATAQLRRELAVNRLMRLTGCSREDFDELTGIEEPKLSFQQQAVGNSSVIIARTELEKAQEELNQYLKDDWEVSLESSYSVEIGNASTPWEDNHTINTGVSSSYNSFTFSGGARTVIRNDGTPNVLGYIQGSWTDDGRKQERDLTEKKLQQAVNTARTQYEQARLNYEVTLEQLRADVGAWEDSGALLDLRERNAQQRVEEAKTALERRVGTTAKVEDAEHGLALLRYDRTLHVLDGLMIQKRIEKAQL